MKPPSPAQPTPPPPVAWRRLPRRSEEREALAAASDHFGKGAAGDICFGPGSQALLQLLPDLLPMGKVAVLGPTYGDHAYRWARAGHAVGEAAIFYKGEPKNVVVFHDERDLAPGKFRMKLGGGAAGNIGIKSVTSQIGPDFRRARSGVGHPGDRNRVTGYVLSDFAKADETRLVDLLDAIAGSIDLLASGDVDAFQTRVTHKAPAPEAGMRGRPDAD